MKVYLNNGSQNGCWLEFATLNLPKLIVRAHTVGLLSELPMIKVADVKDGDQVDVNDKFDMNVTKDIAYPLSLLLALGKIFIVPFVDGKGNLKYETVAYNDDYKGIKYYEEDGELKYLYYKCKQPILHSDGSVRVRVVNNEHYIELDGTYRFKEWYVSGNSMVYLNGNDGSKVLAKGDMMLPFKVDLKINADAFGYPIWYNAKYLIEDSNKTYFELMQELEVNQTIVALPEGLTSQNVRTGDKEVSTLPRRFTVIRGLDEDNKINVYGGNYDPNGYFTTLNNQLSLISLHSGLGNEYLRFDKQGGMRTAKEVVYSQNDTYVNREMLNQTLESILRRLVSAYYYIKFNNPRPYIAIQFEDNIYTSNEDYLDRVQQAFEAGAITKEEYVRNMFPNNKEMLDNIDLENELVE